VSTIALTYNFRRQSKVNYVPSKRKRNQWFGNEFQGQLPTKLSYPKKILKQNNPSYSNKTTVIIPNFPVRGTTEGEDSDRYDFSDVYKSSLVQKRRKKGNDRSNKTKSNSK